MTFKVRLKTGNAIAVARGSSDGRTRFETLSNYSKIGMGMKYFIAGGAGFIGSHLTRSLLGRKTICPSTLEENSNFCCVYPISLYLRKTSIADKL